VITDFKAGSDHIELDGFNPAFDPLAHAQQTGAGVDLDLGQGSHIMLSGVTLAQLHSGDFIFH